MRSPNYQGGAWMSARTPQFAYEKTTNGAHTHPFNTLDDLHNLSACHPRASPVPAH